MFHLQQQHSKILIREEAGMAVFTKTKNKDHLQVIMVHIRWQISISAGSTSYYAIIGKFYPGWDLLKAQLALNKGPCI